MKTIRQTITLRGSPHEVYEAFMDSAKHSQFTGNEATIGKKVGSAFSVFGGYATGKTLKLVPDKKIVQSWRASDWPAKHFSTITITLKRTPRGTSLGFVQTDVPDEFAADIKQGWKDYYWTPMQKLWHN